jgi:hypothetical protein
MGDLRVLRPHAYTAAVGARPPPAVAPSDEAGQLLELQRTAGNTAVAGLVAPGVQRRRDPGDEPDAEAAGAGTAGPAVPATGEDSTAASAAPDAKTRKGLKLGGSHVLKPGDAASVPLPADIEGLRAEWRELDAKRKTAAEAKTPFDPADAARLVEVNRRLKLRNQADAAETLAGNGYAAGPAAWYADVKQTTFLDSRIKVHRLLADRLDAAEAAFLTAVEGQDVPKGGWVRSTSTLRGPTEGLHGLGLAIDLNPGTNPYLVNPSSRSQAATGESHKRSRAVRDVIDRAVLLVLGRTATEEDFGAQPDIDDTTERVKASHDKLSEASAALKTYFTLTADDQASELERLIGELGDLNPKGRTAKRWRKVIKADRSTLGGHARAKDWQRPTKGFMDLPYELVKALTDQGLEWLGDNTIGSGRDIMHFDMRGLGPVKKIFNSEKDRWTSLG